MRTTIAKHLNELFGTGLFTYLVPNYWIMLALAAVVGTVVAARRAPRLRLDPDVCYGVMLWSFPAALVGGRLLDWAASPERYASILDLVDPLGGGMVAYGGFAGGVLMAVAYFRLRQVDTWRYLDCGVLGVGIGTAVTRLGCFLDGCDFGTVTRSFVGVSFPPGSPAFQQHVAAGLIAPTAAGSLPVHPVQLYLALNGLAVAAVAMVWPQRSRPGETFCLYWMVYALGRFALEVLRGDLDRGFIGPLSSAQAISVGVFVVAAVGLYRRRQVDVAPVAGPVPYEALASR